MARKARSLRNGIMPEFLMNLADVLEEGGVPYLRRVAEESPDAFAKLLSRMCSPAMVKYIMAHPNDKELGRVLEITVARLRFGTPAEGKPPKGRLI